MPAFASSVVSECYSSYGFRVVMVQQPVNVWLLLRQVVLPVSAVAAIVAYSDIRIPLGLPGHRGLVWLTLLVMVTLTARRRETVVAVGAAATVATFALHSAAGPAAGVRYVAAAVLLCAVATIPGVHRRPWLLATAAAPIHLVALGGSIVALIGRSYRSASAWAGMTERVEFHLAFGLAAGLLGMVMAIGINYFSRLGSGQRERDRA